MPTDGKIREHAELIVNTCFTVEQGDVVTIITDDEHAHLAKVVAEVAAERGAWPVIMNNETQVARGLEDTLFPMAPPEEPARRDARGGRDHHHDQPRVGESLRPRLGGQGVVRQQRQDRHRSKAAWASGTSRSRTSWPRPTARSRR